MTMQRKHFELIAETVRDMPNANTTERRNIAQWFADKLASTNPNFDRARFLRACGVEG